LSDAPDSGRLDDLYGLFLVLLFNAIGQRKDLTLFCERLLNYFAIDKEIKFVCEPEQEEKRVIMQFFFSISHTIPQLARGGRR
jgi:hypothetical protein